MEPHTTQPQTQEDIENQRKWKHFKGLEGIPFRTKEDGVPYYKEADAQHKQPKVIADMHVCQFNMQEETDRAELERILDRCAKGKGYLSQKEVQFDESLKGWRILIIWGEFFLEDPVEAAQRDEKDTHTFS